MPSPVIPPSFNQAIGKPVGTSDVVAKASTIANSGDIRSALEFLKRFGSPPTQAAGHIILANHYIKNDARWLHHLNGYLEAYRVPPIYLADGPQEKFFRLRARPARTVDDGPLVSIIMSAFNAERTIEVALRSLLVQTWRNIEILVFDDLSTDKTYDVASRLAQEDSRIKVFKNPVNVGPYVSRNRALAHCRGAFVTTQDADDFALPNRIQMQVETLRDHGLGGLVMRAVRITETGLMARIGGEGPRSTDGVLKTSHVSAFFERDVLLNRLGYWDCVRYAADTEMLARATLTLGSKFQEVQRPCILYHENAGSLTSHPVTGTRNGMSPIRMEYRNGWFTWHKTLDKESVFMAFPPTERPFPAPQAMHVPLESIAACIEEDGPPAA